MTDDSPIAARITSTIAQTADTRASETTWNDNDRIGVSATSTEGATAYTNIQYTATDNSF